MNEPNKTYYSISEVCKETGLEPHVLRYWESEFSQLRPKKNRAGNRAYRRKDIELVKYIKQLLYEEQYTIPGARKKIVHHRDEPSEHLAPAGSNGKVDRTEIIAQLKEVLSILRS